jgi:hypothetical protein
VRAWSGRIALYLPDVVLLEQRRWVARAVVYRAMRGTGMGFRDRDSVPSRV